MEHSKRSNPARINFLPSSRVRKKPLVENPTCGSPCALAKATIAREITVQQWFPQEVQPQPNVVALTFFDDLLE